MGSWQQFHVRNSMRVSTFFLNDYRRTISLTGVRRLPVQPAGVPPGPAQHPPSRLWSRGGALCPQHGGRGPGRCSIVKTVSNVVVALCIFRTDTVRIFSKPARSIPTVLCFNRPLSANTGRKYKNKCFFANCEQNLAEWPSNSCFLTFSSGNFLLLRKWRWKLNLVDRRL